MNDEEVVIAQGHDRPTNPDRSKRDVLFVLVGVVAVLVLQWHFSHAWADYYSRFPWRGYEQTMREGHVPPFLTASPGSFLVGSCALFALPWLTLWLGGRPLRSSLALWTGAVISLVGIWVATPRLRQDSNLWPIDLVFLLFATGLPLMAGALTCWVFKRWQDY